MTVTQIFTQFKVASCIIRTLTHFFMLLLMLFTSLQAFSSWSDNRASKSSHLATVTVATGMAVYKSKYPDVTIENALLHEYIMEHFDHYGDSVAMVDGIRGHSYTYGQIQLLVCKIRVGLAAAGFTAGDTLAVMSPNCPEYGLILLAVLSSGGVLTTMNPTYTVDEIVHQLRNSGAKYLITAAPLADKVLKAKQRLTDLKEVFVFGDGRNGCKPYESLLSNDGTTSPARSEVGPEDVALLLYSSGTTGLPKGVMLTHRNVVASMCLRASEPFSSQTRTAGECVQALLPFYHTFGLNACLITSLRRGIKLVTLPRFEPRSFLRTIQEHKVTKLAMVPPLMVFLAKSPLVDEYDLSSVELIGTGAAPLSKEIMQTVADRLKMGMLTQGYGMTETTLGVFLFPTDVVKFGSVGIIIPNTEVKIVDVETGRLLGAGQDGEVWVRGPQIMKGYHGNPEATASCLDKDGFLRTGDIGHIDDEGFAWIVDRLKELIKYKGFQVAPAELEALLLTHPEVLDAAVIGVPDQSAGELPRAFVVRKNESLTAERVSQFVSEKSAPHKWLRGGVVFMEQIPKSPSGKILRRKLRTSLKSSL